MPGKSTDVVKKQMKIADLSRHSGISVSTLYEYQRSGLLPHPEKESPTKAFFTEAHLERLRDILSLKEKGMTLAEIKDQLAPATHERDRPGTADDDVRMAIIDKALELFSTNQYENTKISDITQALNMGNGTFYRYFDSKEELFFDCLDRLPKVLVPKDAWEEVKRESDFVERLKKRGYAMLNAFPSYIGILNHAKLTLGGADKILAGKAAECIRTLVDPLEEDLRLAMAQGLVREVEPNLCSHLLLGVNETFGYLLLMDPNRSVEKDFAVIEDFVRHALAPKKQNETGSTSGFTVELTDRSGNVMVLGNVRWDQSTSVTGKYLEGDLKVDFSVVDVMDIDENIDSRLVASLTMTDHTALTLSVSPDALLSGMTLYGAFDIQVKKLRQIRFSHS